MVGAKENTDKSTLCTISKSLYHGASMQLFQFPSSFNGQVKKNYQQFVKVSSSRSNKVGELPSFCTDVEKIADPQQACYFKVSTVNISENVIKSDFVSIIKK